MNNVRETETKLVGNWFRHDGVKWVRDEGFLQHKGLVTLVAQIFALTGPKINKSFIFIITTVKLWQVILLSEDAFPLVLRFDASICCFYATGIYDADSNTILLRIFLSTY